VEVVVMPEPDPQEREAIATALARLAGDAETPGPYLSAWRRLGIAENLEPDDSSDRSE
jgi:hypothetical protein